ncbi:linoleoyl-CoA desaturase [Catalinimonas alkaloidigena]|uniref:fatty acid desaturase family protein n=1 Tax=Catalinimonas alkaloidigena TaxID=1075417 RepID=UPI0024055584|nr:acyl-CoA desaturase [Catalinimonas alkaloidigena]MDF9798837.1 linoleoyl-CoA desaturase [Catalinimonas alkaloidigena]
MKSSVKFINQEQSKFFPTLRSRVNQYFKDNNISRYGNQEMVTKSVVLISLYLLSYLAVITLPLNAWLFLPLALLMGIAKAGIGMSVMHDALHGSYSKNAQTNKLMGNTIYMVGVNAFVWKVQHNMLHHTYTNIHGLDEDINTKVVIRLSKHAPIRSFHRFQHIYVFFLYGFLTLRMIVDDGMKLINYHRLGIIKKLKSHAGKEYFRLTGFKLIYLFLTIGLPILITSLLWWQVMIGFVLMHLTAGVILSTIFQMAHIVEGAHQPLPNAVGNIENAWAIHQLETTANFSKNSRVLNWYIGGLNFQIEHHLFPNICHVHYRKIAQIVEKTADEFHLPYNIKPTFGHALQSHIRMLKILGQKTSQSVTIAAQQ